MPVYSPGDLVFVKLKHLPIYKTYWPGVNKGHGNEWSGSLHNPPIWTKRYYVSSFNVCRATENMMQWAEAQNGELQGAIREMRRDMR